MKFEELYPNLSKFIKTQGWMTVGSDEYSYSLIRIIDLGGLIWESDKSVKSINEGLDIAEKFIKNWIEENS